MPSPEKNVTLDEILEEFLRLFSKKELFCEADNGLIHSAKEHLAGNPAPNPGGFLVDIPRVISPYLTIGSLSEAVTDMGRSGVKFENTSMPEPFKKIIAEAIFIVAVAKLQEKIPKAWRSLRE